MAQECNETSVAISSSTPPSAWWDNLHHAASLSPWHHQQNRSSNSSCEEDVSMSTSFVNCSNHSGLTVESSHQLVEPAAASSPTELIGEHASDSQLWSHFLLAVGSNGELENNPDVGENLLDALSSKNSISSGIFEPACDYLKKIDNNSNNLWEFTNSPSFNHLDNKHINNTTYTTTADHSLIENHERLSKQSNLVGNWSIAPPDPGLINREVDPVTFNISSSSCSLCHHSQPQTYSTESGLSCYGCHGLKVENDQRRHVGAAAAAGYFFRRSFVSSNGVGYHIGLNNNSVMTDNNKYYCGALPDNNTCASARNFTDCVAFNGRFNKPLIDVQAHKPCFKSLNLSDCRKQGLQTSLPTGRGHGNTREGKKKRSEETSEMVLKKCKHESSTVSSVKMQAPKVKLGDRITALQQIVSPFGKTDTASVLLESIQYIKFLQEQVQLLSNPYMKANTPKDPWRTGLDKKDKGDVKLDLRSRGLCLVPISCTPQVYHENTGSDYWTPTYRSGCLYR